MLCAAPPADSGPRICVEKSVRGAVRFFAGRGIKQGDL